jgi:DNA-binding response OmpR family regulator
METILIIEDDAAMLRGLKDNFEYQGYGVLTAADGEDGLNAALDKKPDLIILDIMLPKINGYEICRLIRQEKLEMPIIMLTAKGEESDIILGLNLGADDYVTKPFSPKELVARVRAVFRRVEAAEKPPEIIRALDITLDVGSMRLLVGDRNVELTPTEFQLLAKLASQPGRIFTRAQLLESIHGVAIESYERAIDAHIKNLRRKIEPEPSQPRYILTVYGVGYRFSDEAQ